MNPFIEEEKSVYAAYQALAMQPDPDFPVHGTLYFLDGHYLFRYNDGNKVSSKFVTAADLAAAFSHTEQDTGWLDAGIVRVGSNPQGTWFCYSAPAQKVEISLTNERPLTVPIPRTVLLGIDNGWYLWALKEKYFQLSAQAYKAPFPNVHPDGKICWGQNTAPKADPNKAREVWALFFSSPFNGDLADHKSNARPEDVRAVMRGLAEEKARTYPLNDLVSAGMQIGKLIDNKIGVH